MKTINELKAENNISKIETVQLNNIGGALDGGAYTIEGNLVLYVNHGQFHLGLGIGKDGLEIEINNWSWGF